MPSVPSHHSLSRRQFLHLLAIGAVSGSAVISLSACGSGTDSAKPTGNTRTVKDVEDNDVEVPEHPQRIVAMSEPTTDALLALGITPVGVTAGRGQQTISSYLMDKGKDIPILGIVGQPNYEEIGKAKPDLILVDGTSINNNPPLVDALKKIAPTVYTGYAGADWRENFRLVIDALNMKDEGEKLISEIEGEAADLKNQLAPKYGDKTFSIIRWQGSAPALILKELPAGRALTDLGLKRPPDQDHFGRGHSDPVSIENMKTIDADYMFFGSLGGSSVGNPNAGGAADAEAGAKAIEEATKVQGFTDLQCYKDNHIIPVDGAAWTSTGGPLLIRRIYDDVRKSLL